MFKNDRPVRISITYLLAFSLLGCYSSQTVTSDELLKDNKRSIQVMLVDSTTIQFDSQEYTVGKDGDSSYIAGSGIQKRDASEGGTRYQGRIYFAEIQNILTIGPSAVTQIMTPIVGTIILGALVLVIVGLTSDVTMH